MAEGIRAAVGRSQLMSFHPTGQHHSSQYFHKDDWLDFNMVQSGHIQNNENWKFITKDYALTPVKPCMDAEPGYENIASHFDPKNGFMTAHDSRKFAYWALFAGAHGHTYGCNEVWQMWQPGREPVLHAHLPWKEAIKLPGSSQMQYAKRLLLSRPFFNRIPDQSILAMEDGAGAYHVRATRASDGSYAMIYLPCANSCRSIWTKSPVNGQSHGGTTLVPARRSRRARSRPAACNSSSPRLCLMEATGCWFWMKRAAGLPSRVSRHRLADNESGNICERETVP